MALVGSLLFWILVVIFLLACLLSFFTVNTAQVAIVTRFGKFLRVAEAGLNWNGRLSTGSPAV
jgi:regulator of protease activity HflC (stomatin/prohibitin superfamily)